MNLNKIPDSSRIHFLGNYQQELMLLAKKKAIERFPHESWRKVVAKVIARNPRMVSHYKCQGSALTARQVRSLSDFISLPTKEIDKHIAKVRKNYEWCSDGGKACFRKYGKDHYIEISKKAGKMVGNMLFQKYGSEYFRKKGKLGGRLGYETILRKYGIEKLREWAYKAAPIGGLKSAENRFPTKQQKRLAEWNSKCGLVLNEDFELNYTVKFGEGTAYNFDFAYFKNFNLLALEEATAVAPSRADVYSRVLDIIERKKWLEEHGLNIPIMFSVERVKNVGREFKFPADMLLVLMGENIIPVFSDDLDSRTNVIKCFFENKSPTSYIHRLREWAFNDIRSRRKFMERMAKGERNRAMNPAELLVHNKLREIGLQPQGKVILESPYGSFMVPDNSFIADGTKWYVFVSRSSLSSLKNHISHLAGYSFMLKHIFDPAGKCMVAILGDSHPLKLPVNNKWMRYLSKFSEVIVFNGNFSAVYEFIKTPGVDILPRFHESEALRGAYDI